MDNKRKNYKIWKSNSSALVSFRIDHGFLVLIFIVLMQIPTTTAKRWRISTRNLGIASDEGAEMAGPYKKCYKLWKDDQSATVNKWHPNKLCYTFK